MNQKEARRLMIIAARKSRPDFSENIIEELNCEYLGMLYKRSLRDKSDFLDIFNLDYTDVINASLLSPEGNHPMRTVFMEICFINRI